MDKTIILQRAKEVLNIEATGIVSLIDRLDDRFVQAIELLYNCRGKVVVTGLGKSGLVCRKIAATFSSMGTPSFLLHARSSPPRRSARTTSRAVAVPPACRRTI